MLIKSLLVNKILYRSFHTSSPRHVHPIIWVFLKPTLKFAAMLTGRSTRKWYKGLPPEKRSVLFSHLNRQKYKYMGIIGSLATVIGIHYYTHLETVPLVGRTRYMVLKRENLQTFLESARDKKAIDHHAAVLPADSKHTQFVSRVVKRILMANMDIPEIEAVKWSVRVVETPIENAFVLPTGDIYVYRGILKTMINEDQLAIILGHEIAHALLGHSVEELSHSRIVDTIAILGSFVLWMIFPNDIASLFATFAMEKIITVSSRLPYSRRMEEEADKIGLLLAAKACYDVRQSSIYWRTIADKKNKAVESEYKSTHPSDHKRALKFTELLPWAMNIRCEYKCPELK